ncbi:hypothetical protein SDJN02_05697 [Cucurbita argyrosperma subsp. argyrosperma]|nr:hypothetical protein SDJN02_05697 [Cucurbita argyrosperma subsp. argyrosperma]
MLNPKPFAGGNVFVSCNLVAQEIFDALKQNGADVFICCDPSRSGGKVRGSSREGVQFVRHVSISSSPSSAGVGPECNFSTDEPLPQQDFTCCLAMDGVKILASVREVSYCNGRSIAYKSISRFTFIVVKNVLAAKYKTAEIVEWINQKGEGRLLRTTRETTSKSSVVTLHVPDVAAAIENFLEQTR